MADTMSARHPESEGSSDGSRSDLTRGGNTITCSICQAVYAPVQVYEYLLQAPRVALESAFMSMCHFCFRCRRPACPNCWDYVHGVCGACSLEAKLPFRTPSTPLQGVVFPPIRQTQPRYSRAPQTRLTCIRPGKFQSVAPIDSAEPASDRTVTTQSNTLQALKIPAPLPTMKDRQQPSSRIMPPVSSQTAEPSIEVNIDEIATKPERRDTFLIDEIITQPGRRDTPPIDEIATRPEPGYNRAIDEIATNLPRHSTPSIDEIVMAPEVHRSTARRIERMLIMILLTLLLAIALLIVLAELFQDANTLILQFAHIDIRAEVAYILLLIRQVFF